MPLKANTNPHPQHRRKFNVSHHALERLRDRHHDPKSLISHPDVDLFNMIDERIRHCTEKEEIVDHTYGGTPTTIYKLDLEDRGFGRLIAVVRENTCVTLLEERMLDLNLIEKKWTRWSDSPFAVLKNVKPFARPPLQAKPEALAARGPAPAPAVIVDIADPVVEAGGALAKAMRAVAQCERRIANLRAEADAIQQGTLPGLQHEIELATVELNLAIDNNPVTKET